MCCCNYGCCCCAYPKKSTNGCCKLVLVIFFLACAGTIVGLSIAGVVFSATLMDKYNNSKCAIYLLIDETLAGANKDYSPESTWIGAKPVEKLIDSAILLLEENEEQLKEIGRVEITSNFESTYDFLEGLNVKFDNEKVADPTKPTGSLPLLTLDMFKKNAEGDPREYPFIEILRKEVEMFETDITSAIKGLTSGAKTIAEGTAINDARNAINSIGDFDEQIDDFKKTIYDAVDSVKIGFKYGRLGTCLYFALIIGFIVVILLGSVPAVTCNSKCCRCVSSLGCVLLAIFMTVGFLLTAILFPVSVIIIEVCDLMEPKQLEKDGGIISSISEDTWGEIGGCLSTNGNSNLYETKGLGDDLNFANESVDGLNYTSLFYNETEEKMKYPAAESLIEELNRIADEAPYEASKSTFPDEKLDWEDVPRGDTIVWSGCTPKVEITEAYLKTDGRICLPIVECIGHQGDIETRYGHTEFTDKLIRHIDYAKAVKDKIKILKESIERGETEAYMTKMDEDTKNAGIEPVMSEANNMGNLTEAIEQMNLLANELHVGLDCSFMRNGIDRLYDSVFGGLTQVLTFIALMLGLISAISLLLIISMVCINRNFYPLKIPKNNYSKPGAEKI